MNLQINKLGVTHLVNSCGNVLLYMCNVTCLDKSLSVRIFVLGPNVSNRINPRNRLSLVRIDEIHNENPWLFQPRRKWDCVWPKRAISGSPIYPVARTFLKICRH